MTIRGTLKLRLQVNTLKFVVISAAKFALESKIDPIGGCTGEILIGMVIHMLPEKKYIELQCVLFLGHFKQTYYDNISWMSVEAMSQLKYKKKSFESCLQFLRCPGNTLQQKFIW